MVHRTVTLCSVVLASFEGERFIREQIESILVQLGPDDEIIVSDDASSDGTVDVVRRIGDSRIHVLENRDRVGYVLNFQRAVDRVRGQYVFFSDQDDVWLPGKMRSLCTALQSKRLVASDAVVVDENLRVLHESFFGWRRATSFSWQSIFLRPTVVGATMCCTHDYLKSLLPLPAQVPHDFWLSFNAALDGAMEIIPIPLILYRRHAAAFSPSATDRTRPFSRIAAERCALAWLTSTHRLRPRKK
jgi:glycosyltransferase involved in cell wall biosynthesis